MDSTSRRILIPSPTRWRASSTRPTAGASKARASTRSTRSGRYYGKPWFNLGDRDLATHLYRTERLRAGDSLSEVTADIAERFGIGARILPMSDDRVRTFVKLKGRPPLPFQEYFVRRRARGKVESIELRGIKEASAASRGARRRSPTRARLFSRPRIRLFPSRPSLTLRVCVKRSSQLVARVAAISPIVGGKTIKGPADKMLRGLGHEVSPLAVARLYQDFLGAFILDTVDHRYIEPIRALGIRAVATDTIMSTPAKAARLADVVMRALEV